MAAREVVRMAPSYNPGTGGAPITPVVDGGRPPRCDDAGNCVCMNIAEIGTAGQFGSNPGQDGDVAFQSWMNDPANSNAHVDLFKTKPTLKSQHFSPATTNWYSNRYPIIQRAVSIGRSRRMKSMP